MVTVRPYQKKDFRFVQDICLEVSPFSARQTPANRALFCAMYCDYYLDEEPDFCFVAVDDNDEPVGYILCSADADNYRDRIAEEYLSLTRKISSAEYFRFAAEVKVGEHCARQGYSAHFYVSVLPEFQHQGIGTQLVKAALDKLSEKFVEGVYAVCGSKNAEGKAFCQKIGLDDIDYIAGAVVYGKKLYAEE